MSPHPEPVQDGQAAATADCCSRKTRECNVLRSELRRVTIALEEMTQERDTWMGSSAGYGSDMVEWKIRAEAAERDLAALQEESANNRHAFEITEADRDATVRRYHEREEAHAQALRDAFRAGWETGVIWLDFKQHGGMYPSSPEPPNQEEAFAAFLASRKDKQQW